MLSFSIFVRGCFPYDGCIPRNARHDEHTRNPRPYALQPAPRR